MGYFKKNLQRFPADFAFQLTEEEFKRVQQEDASIDTRPSLPYAFTALGIAMVSSILKSKAAIKVSIEIMRSVTSGKLWEWILGKPAAKEGNEE